MVLYKPHKFCRILAADNPSIAVMGVMAFRSAENGLFIQHLVQTNNKENIKVRMAGPLCGKSTGQLHIT